MFGFYYHDPRRPDPGDVFGSFLAFLVIVGILFAVTLYLGYIVLLIFLGIGSLIGLIYAIIVYVKSFIDACGTLGCMHGRNKLTSFLVKWWRLLKNTSLNAFKSNLSVAHSALIKAGGYRFLSFRKWMWFIVAPTVLIFGTAMIVFIILVQLLLMLILSLIILFIAMIALAIYVLIGIGYSFWSVIPITILAFSGNNPFGALDFSRYFTFSNYGNFIKQYFSALFRWVKTLWGDSVSLVGSNFAKAGRYVAINPIKYFFYISSLTIMALACVIIGLVVVVLSIVFIPIAIAEIIWALIAKIIK